MNNSSVSDDVAWGQNEIDAIWRSVNNTPSDPVSYWVSIASFIFAILGLISNSMSVVVLSRLSAQLSTFIYLTGLSLSDMITCISIVMTHSLDFFVGTRRSTPLTKFLQYVAIIFGALAAGSRVLSLWISTAVTMDRWVLICYPIYAKTFCTLHRARIISWTIFLIALCYSIPLLFEYELIEMPIIYQNIDLTNESSSSIDTMSNNKNGMLVTKGYSDLAKRRLYRWAYMFFNAIFVYTVPTITIVCFNVQLIRALHRLKSRAKRLGSKSPSNGSDHRGQNRSNQSKYSVTMMVVIMVLTLLICRSPTYVLWMLWSFELTIKAFFESSSSSMVRRFHNIANLIAIINAATNFLPFCVFGQLFRAECLTIYCCRKPIHHSLTTPSSKRKDHEGNQRKKAQVIVQEPGTMRYDPSPTILLLNSHTSSVFTPLMNEANVR